MVVGDPAELLTPPGAGRWHGTAVRPGRWHALGRPADPAVPGSHGSGDELVEVVLVHDDALGAFWDLYDDASPAAAFLLPTRRVLVVDGASRTDAELLKSAAEPEELPWMLDHGLVVSGVAQHPAHVWQPKGTEVSLVAIALDRAPSHQAPADALASGTDRDED